MDRDINDMLLSSWLRVSAGIRNERLVNTMTFNEVFTCNILYNSEGKDVTASDIGEITGMLKSQVNRVLVGLENSGYVERKQSGTDKRKAFVKLTEEGKAAYLKEHEHVLSIFDGLSKKVGPQKMLQAAGLLTELAEAIKSIENDSKERR